MPKPKENILKFKNYNHSLKVPFIIYADFECMLQKIYTCQPPDETSYTKAYQKRTPTNFAYYIKYSNGKYKPPVEYSGLDAAEVFYKKLREDVLYIVKNYYDKVVPMKLLTELEKLKFKTQKNYHICEKPFDNISEKVHDHDHLTGQLRGAAHNSCNLTYQNPRFIPIFFTIYQDTTLIYLLNNLVKTIMI